MIAYIKGTIEAVEEDSVLIENSGMGYRVYMPINELTKVKLHEMMKIVTFQHFKEDGTTLYGFLEADTEKMFRTLINVSGVGPKAALSILACLSSQNIIMAIISNDDKTLCKAQGVGKKLAQRIILELKDKFKNYDFIVNIQDNESSNSDMEAISALISLGYTRQEAITALSGIDTSGGVEDTVKLALKMLMKG